MDELAALEDDLLGDDDDVLGARRAVARAVRKGLRRPPIGTKSQLRSQPVAAKRVPLGMGTATFTNASTSTSQTVEVEPQRDFQGERLVITVGLAGGATQTIAVRSIKVGDIEQLPNTLGIPADMFARDATQAQVDFSLCPRGCKLTITYEISAIPGAGQTVTVTAGIYGMVAGQ